MLVEDTDYEVTDDNGTEILATLAAFFGNLDSALGKGDELVFTMSFDVGHNTVLTVTVVDSTLLLSGTVTDKNTGLTIDASRVNV